MANNTILNPGAAGDTIATEDIGGVKHELIKVEFGVDGVATKVSAGNPLPVTDNAAEVSLASIDLGIPAGLGQTTMAASMPVAIASNQSSIPVTGTLSPTSDIAPATQNITVVDSGSTTTSGANNQSIIIGTPTAGSAASFAISGIETIRVEVTGIWTGTISAEASIDGGTVWVGQGLHQGAYTTASFTAGFVGGANIAGATNFRIRATQAITGTVVVKIIESINTQSVYIANAAPSGTVISVLNSTIITLGANAVYTGTGEDVTNFSEMRVSVISNQASATDGLSIQQSPDNTNWDITDVYTITAASAKTFVVPRQARYFRIVYTNGSTLQGSFRLQSILNRTATAPSSQRPNDAYTNETDCVQNQVFPMLFNGTTWDRARGTIANGLSVDVTRVSSVTLNSDVRQATASNLNAQVVGNVAHGTTDSGNPVKVGLKAISLGANPTAVAAGQRTDVYANRAGVQFVMGGHPNIVCLRATYTTAQTNVAIVTVATGLKIVVTRLSVTASAANSVNPSVIIGFGTATTPTTAGVVLSHPGVAPGSGVIEGNGAGMLGVGADDEDLRITSSVPTSGSIDVVVSYFTIDG